MGISGLCVCVRAFQWCPCPSMARAAPVAAQRTRPPIAPRSRPKPHRPLPPTLAPPPRGRPSRSHPAPTAPPHPPPPPAWMGWTWPARVAPRTQTQSAVRATCRPSWVPAASAAELPLRTATRREVCAHDVAVWLHFALLSSSVFGVVEFTHI